MTNEYDEILDEVNSITPEEYKETELKAIVDLARGLGLYEWKYEDEVPGVDRQLHIGPIAQDLLRIDGLKSAVKQLEDGTFVIDSKYVALAALSYCATLARILANIKYEGPNKEGVE